MPVGRSHCRICGKVIPSTYRKSHEKFWCLKMRFDRGDPDVRARFPNGLNAPEPVVVKGKLEPGQVRLFEVSGVVA